MGILPPDPWKKPGDVISYSASLFFPLVLCIPPPTSSQANWLHPPQVAVLWGTLFCIIQHSTTISVSHDSSTVSLFQAQDVWIQLAIN